jgi:hypothetical protein
LRPHEPVTTAQSPQFNVTANEVRSEPRAQRTVGSELRNVEVVGAQASA